LTLILKKSRKNLPVAGCVSQITGLPLCHFLLNAVSPFHLFKFSPPLAFGNFYSSSQVRILQFLTNTLTYTMNKPLFFLLFSFLLNQTAYSQPANQTPGIIYVKEGAQGDGSSWQHATDDLRAALLRAGMGTQVWVAEGNYYPVQCNPCSDSQRRLSFEIPDGVGLFGGFSGKETSLRQRKWKDHPTTLSGNIGRDDNSDNTYNVVFSKGIQTPTLIDGFIIADGNANLPGQPGERYGSGAGWYNDGTGARSNPIIRNCIFMHNQSLDGGAFFNNGYQGDASPVLEHCGFVENKAANAGGAMFNLGTDGSCSPVLANCKFVGNEAIAGGAIFQTVSPLGGLFLPHECFFISNKADFGGAIFQLGGDEDHQPNFLECHFVNNKGKKGEDFCIKQGDKMPEEVTEAMMSSKM
jgi:hypothetical protein